MYHPVIRIYGALVLFLRCRVHLCKDSQLCDAELQISTRYGSILNGVFLPSCLQTSKTSFSEMQLDFVVTPTKLCDDCSLGHKLNCQDGDDM